MNYSEQILKARFEQLPEDIKEAITATPWKEKLRQISEKHNLHIDQAGHLGEETVLVMFGIEHADNLIANIAKHVEVSEEKAEAIAEDLNREIFLKVRESLKKIFEERDEEGSSFLDDSLLGKTGEEELNREDILREIEDKEHHNLPTISNPELHLEVSPPSELAVKQPDEIMVAPSENQSIAPTIEAPATIKHDIFKEKMSGMVNIPKETVIINDSVSPTKTNPTKVDPYREQVG